MYIDIVHCVITLFSQMQLRMFFSPPEYCVLRGGGEKFGQCPKVQSFSYVTASQWSCRYFSCGATCIIYLGFSPNKKVSAKLSSVHKVIFVQGVQFSRASFWTLPKKSIMRYWLMNHYLWCTRHRSMIHALIWRKVLWTRAFHLHRAKSFVLPAPNQVIITLSK